MMFFYVIGVKNVIIRTLIDALRLFADPSQKHSAHITVRGPYEGDENYIPSSFHVWENELIGTHVIIKGIDTFFNVEQNTVYFNCESEELKKVWWKKHFKNYTPHITIYDKKDRNLANEIVKIFENIQINFSFKVYSLDKLISDSRKSPRIQGKLFERLIYSIDLELLSNILGEQINKKTILDASLMDRIDYIRRVALLLSEINSEEQLENRIHF